MDVNNSTAQPPSVIPALPDDRHIFDIPQVRALLIVLYTIIFIFCFFGNLTVIFVVTFHSRMRNMTQFFLGNLAFANLCVGIFCIYQSLTTFIYESWFYGDLMCRMYHFTQSLCHTASILILIAIAVERYVVLLHPFRSRQMTTLRRLAVILTVVWITSAAIASPRLYYFGTIKIPIRNQKKDTICVPKRTLYDSAMADTIYFVLLYVVPLTIITILYTRIAQNLRQSVVLRGAVAVSSTGAAVNSASRQSDVVHNRDGVRIQIPSKRNRFHSFRKRHNSSSSSLSSSLRHNSSVDIQTITSKKRMFPWRRRPVSKYDDFTEVTIISVCTAGAFRRGSLDFKIEAVQRKLRLSWPQRQHPPLTRSRSEPTFSNDYEMFDVNSNNKNHNKTTEARVSVSGASLTSTMTSTRIRSVDAARLQVNQRLYAVRVLIVIVMSFAALNLPFHIRKLCLNYLPSFDADSDVNHLLTPLTFLLMYTNCAISPILYAFLSKKFRQSFCDLICWRRRSDRGRLLDSVRMTGTV